LVITPTIFSAAGPPRGLFFCGMLRHHATNSDLATPQAERTILSERNNLGC
jgi:hypothetical protein